MKGKKRDNVVEI